MQSVLKQFDLSGRTALITGSSAGIGLALAQGLAGAGAAVVLNVRHASQAGAARAGRHRARHMIARKRGKIINLCSVQSELGRPNIAPYTASKGAVKNGLGEQLAAGQAVDVHEHPPAPALHQPLIDAVRHVGRRNEDNLESCAVVLVVLGRQWASLADANGVRRIESPDDYPRMEVAAALRRGIRVIPVLAGDAMLPKAQELPPDVAGLVERQVVRVSRERFDADMRELIDAVALDMPRDRWRAASWRAWTAFAAGLAGIAAVAAFLVFEPTAPPRRQAAADAPAPARADEPLVGAGRKPAAGRAVVIASAPAVAPSGTPAVAEMAASAGAAAATASQPRSELRTKGPAPAQQAGAMATTARGQGADPAPNLTGEWLSTSFESAYSSHRHSLLFEFVQQDQIILGTVVDVSDPGRRFSRPIVHGRIKSNVLSFHTEGESCCNKDGSYSHYKTMYVGTSVKGTRRIDFRRYNDVSSGGQTERFSASPKN